MSTITEEKGELISLAEYNQKSLFDGSSMDSMLAQIEAKARSYDLDISTPAGRKEIASVAYKIAQSKTAIDAAGKKLVEGIKAEAKVIDDERKKARDYLDALKDEIRKPLTDFENAEKERVATLETRLARIEYAALNVPEDAASIQATLNNLTAVDSTTFQEFEKRAAGLIAVAKEKLSEKLAIVTKREEEAAELERLRAEAAERERIDREARIAAEAAEKARLEAEQKAEKERAEAEAAHQRAIEAERKAAEIAAEKEAKRVANEKHRGHVRGSILAALISEGVDSTEAARVISAVDAGKISGMSINY